jgi:UDP-N-acetylmuramyl pentapeptide synthase
MSAENVILCKDHGDVAERLKGQVKKGDWLLVKGSRGMKMEQVLDALEG